MLKYDTFVGKIICPYCGEIIEFKEHTSDYGCSMQTFQLGNFIDKENTNYFYSLNTLCPCNKILPIYVAIRKGQIVGYYTNIKNVRIEELNNF